jgi:putative redox protein
MVEVNAIYEGELHCSAEHGPSGAFIQTDAPVDNHGKGEAFSPTDLVGTAMGTCMLTIMGIYAKQKGIDITGTKVRVTKEMTAELPRMIARLGTTIEVPLPENHPSRGALEAAALGCPVHRSLHPNIEKPVDFVWLPNAI